MSLNIIERAELVVHHARMLRQIVDAQGVQIPVTIKYGAAEVYVTRGYDQKKLRVDVSWEEPVDANSSAQ